jgi:alpha-mannosidase
MRTDKVFHVISNTHWDREWRFPFQRNRQMLVDMIDSVLDILVKEPKYRAFHLDSQSIVLRDYLEIKPHKKKLIVKLVKENRLLIGPWYILPEEFQVGGENLIRNLLLGHKVCAEHGGVSKIGYSPFSWGQISQLPQLYKEFGINLIMFYRGINSIDSPKAEFLWEGADGTRAISSRFSTMPRYNFYFYIYRPVVHNEGFYDVEYKWSKGGKPFHFADIEQHEEDFFIIEPLDDYYEENLKEWVEKIVNDQADDFTTPHAIWMEGHDSSGPNIKTVRIIEDIKKIFPEINIKHSTLEEYANAVFESADEKKLKLVKGERRSSQFDRRSGNMYGYTTSARMFLKQKNFDAERWVQFYAEPFNSFAGILGKDIKDYYLENAWEKIVQNSAHDSIGGCSLDEIHDDMMNRYKQSIEISRGVFERAVKYISNRIDTSSLIFSLLY